MALSRFAEESIRFYRTKRSVKMKKKLISFLLIVVLVAALIPVSAFAEPAVAIYTLTGTTSIVDLCAAHGVDYNTYKVLIMALNNVSNENAFASMGAGSRVVVPISGQAAATLAGISGAGIISGAAPGTAPAPGNNASSVGVASKLNAGDTISCYVLSYTIKSGDTIIGLYKSRDLNYKTYATLIEKLNKNVNFNKLRVGQTLLLPVNAVTTGDTVVYTIMSHVMKSGDTVYNVISNGYGMNYKANTELLQTVNSKENLASFKVGETLHIAVNGYVSPAALNAAVY